MTNFSHLDAINARIFRETFRMDNAVSKNEINFLRRQVLIAEKELADEYKFLGIVPFVANKMSDDELLAELTV